MVRHGTRLEKQEVYELMTCCGGLVVDCEEIDHVDAVLVISGGSNVRGGGCDDERPKLFGALFPAVGVLEHAARFHDLWPGTSGLMNTGLAQSPVRNQNAAGDSPYHNVSTCSMSPAVTMKWPTPTTAGGPSESSGCLPRSTLRRRPRFRAEIETVVHARARQSASASTRPPIDGRFVAGRWGCSVPN